MQQQVLMKNPQDAYRRQSVLTASPMELIIMLYDGMRKNLLFAQRAIEKDNVSSAHTYLMKAQEIVVELINSLDMSVPLSKELLDFYEVVLRLMAEANLSKDATHIPPILEIIESMRQTWQEVADMQKGGLELHEEIG